jgi:nickel superoxide dismutase
MKNITLQIHEWFQAEEVAAHCDGPCGVYDPADARIKAEAVLSMTKKILALAPPADSNPQAWAAYLNTMARYIQIKEDQAHKAKTELLVLWTDYFKPQHLEQYPDLHEVFWKAAKLCSACKVEVSLEKATELVETVKKVHQIFWATKGRDVTFYLAS